MVRAPRPSRRLRFSALNPAPPRRRQLASTSCWARGGASPFPNRTAACAGAACCADNDYLASGSATVSFLLADVRTEYVFALVQGSTTTATAQQQRERHQQ